MTHLIITMLAATGIVALAATIEKHPESARSATAVMFVDSPTNDSGKAQSAQKTKKGKSAKKSATSAVAKTTEISDKDRRDAAKYGYEVSAWCALTKKARTEIRQKARAEKMGLTVEQMKEQNLRKAAERAGCPVDKWKAMSVKERNEFRKQTKQQPEAKPTPSEQQSAKVECTL